MDFWNIVVEAGVTMWVILFCSLLAVFIFIGKWFQFHRAQINVRELVSGLINVLQRDGMIEALTLCDNTPGPVARILTAAIQAYQNEDDIQRAIDDAVLVELPQLESHLNVLGTIAKAAPLLGLLGTVIGMQETFAAMRNSMALNDLSGGISTALLTTGAGLALAIPCLIAYNYLVARVETFCIEMEKASSEILYFFEHKDDSRKNESAEN
ncbi:MAG: MotA/TolQ/ExbB proton channel family protein [Lentisphaeria bacterium]|nr:MotA/TolQ/ExbB proton channel family protein [Lentisphaeria bacterium]